MSEEMNKEYFKKLAKQLMFELSDEESEDIVKEFETLNKQLALLEKVNTDGVEPMVYPFEDETTFLREDEVTHVISQEDALANVKDKIEGHFILPKVVK
ncbi:MAG: Asp-tRNA(Asn)/Glu-tRNA(Gln) amidotransferase subunit GatC [Solobacterium sp.]|nr:Asp-tRNA(Asn)/Glu-tRNA(Gln) amidotransferase subunit GatC [Solobacterium sp.]